MSVLIPKDRKGPNIKVSKDNRKKNYSTEARSIYVKGFLQNRTYPDFMRTQAIEIIQMHFRLLGETLSAIELTHLRYIQHEKKKEKA